MKILTFIEILKKNIENILNHLKNIHLNIL